MNKVPRFSVRSAPVAIFALCALAFGPLISQLGFYWDDWPVVQTIYLKADLWEFYAYNRPASAWTQAFFAPLLGVSPLNWHVFAEVCWALTAVAFWWMLQELWPEKRRTNVMMALLFAVHPVYQLHAIAVAFSQQYLTYLPFFISFAAMLASLRQPNRFWMWMGLGVGTNLIHAFSMEYFWGLEILRPVFIYMVLRETRPRGRILAGLKIWLPYVLATGTAIIWRTFFVQLAEPDPNELVFLEKLAVAPFAGLLELVQVFIKDIAYIMVIRWYETFQVAWLNLSDRFGLVVWGIWTVVAVSFWVYLRGLEKDETPERPGSSIGFQVVLGLFAMLAGGMAVWLVGRELTVGLYADRFALPLLVGVVMVTVGLVEIIVRPGVKPLVFAILLGLSVTIQLRTQNDYRWDWVKQQRGFWQLYWRAPALAEDTAIFSDGTLFRFTGGYPTAAALNVLYPQQDEDERMDYWFLELDRGYFRVLSEMIEADYPLTANFRQYTFSSSSRKSLVVFFAPEEGNCLWVMRGSDMHNPDIPDLTKKAVPLSNLDQIRVDGADRLPDSRIFGAEPARTWCYFYEKAELARQEEDWAGIVQLAEESASQGFKPNNRLEWLPFVEAFAHTGDWEQAMELSVSAWQADNSSHALFCPVWRGFEREGLEAPEGTFSEVYERLKCEVRENE